MSQMRAVESRPPVTRRSREGCRAIANTALKWPWYYRTTLFCSRSQHLTILSSPHEKRYGCLSLTTRPLTVLICPVNVSFSCPFTRSQNFIVLSLEPVTKNLFIGSTAMQRTHPEWPLMTRLSFQGACHCYSTSFCWRRAIWFSLLFMAFIRLVYISSLRAFWLMPGTSWLFLLAIYPFSSFLIATIPFYSSDCPFCTIYLSLSFYFLNISCFSRV